MRDTGVVTYSKDAERQVRVVSFRPDDEIRRFLKRKFQVKRILKNKSAFHQEVYRAGIKTLMGAA